MKDDDKSYMGLITKAVRDAAGIELGDEPFMNLLSTKEEENLSPSLTPSQQGRGNAGDLPSGGENKTYEGKKTSEEDKTIAEKFPLPLLERVGVRGTLKGKFPLGNSGVFVEYFRFDETHRPLKPQQRRK